MNDLEQVPLTVGLAIFIVFIIGGVVTSVWAIAAIRNNDKKEMREDWQNALKNEVQTLQKEHTSISKDLTRLETKTDKNNDYQHLRQSKTIDDIAAVNANVHYIKGALDNIQKGLKGE